MTDDIVTRLRKGNFDCLHGKEVDVFHLTIDAADAIESRDAEIERLRAKNKRLGFLLFSYERAFKVFSEQTPIRTGGAW